MAYYSNSKGL